MFVSRGSCVFRNELAFASVPEEFADGGLVTDIQYVPRSCCCSGIFEIVVLTDHIAYRFSHFGNGASHGTNGLLALGGGFSAGSPVRCGGLKHVFIF